MVSEALCGLMDTILLRVSLVIVPAKSPRVPLMEMFDHMMSYNREVLCGLLTILL